ncbi:hypothetical protein HDU93_007979 [Gonapodya sp. JEL0774]|nr:hypothetical protein HDU93_007979 [Gonapodya sp. JEL0774]
MPRSNKPSAAILLLIFLFALFTVSTMVSANGEERDLPTTSHRYIITFKKTHQVSSDSMSAYSELTILGFEVVRKLPIINALVVTVSDEAFATLQTENVYKDGKEVGKGVMATLEALEGVDYVEEDKHMHANI